MYSKGNENNGLTPIISNWMEQVMGDSSLIEELVVKYGSPVNLHHLDTFEKNIQNFREVFESYDLRYQIYYARKANKSRALVKKALSTGIGVDTASFRELEQSLELGGNGDSLVLTSAIKTKDQFVTAINTGVPVVLDNDDECQLANSIAKELGKPAIVGMRVSGFHVEDEKLYSRFGFDIDDIQQFIIDNIGKDKKYDQLKVAGLHFHLDGYSTQQRGKALSDCIDLANELAEHGHEIDFIDIGGGILINYLQSEQEWTNFDKNLREQVATAEGNLTFNNNGLGYELINGNVERSLKTYPYFNKINGADFLREVLDFKKERDLKSNAQRLKENNYQIRIEPGRSLLNQIGMTIAKVAHRKKDSKGQWLVGLEMNMSQMMSSSEDFLLDPYLIHQENLQKDENVEVFFTGAYCLERDVLLKRKISLPQLPEIGDYVAFVNTAGYMMHFFETEAHLFELSANLSFSDAEKLTISDFTEDEDL